MYKMVAFDIDGTLAPHHEQSSNVVLNHLKSLEKKGIIICLISGKPIAYVAGMARQMGLKNPIVSGENGAVIYFGIDFPVLKEIKFSYTKEEAEILNDYKTYILEIYRNKIWIQPNIVNFSFFVQDEHIKSMIDSYTQTYFKDTNFEYYLHPDGCFDIVRKGVNKGWAIQQLKEELKLSYHNIATIGDGSNDVPMFKETLYAIGINRKDTPVNVSNINEAFYVLNEILNLEKKCPQCGHKKIMYWSIESEKKVLAECDKCEYTASPYHFQNFSFYNIKI